VDPVPVDGIFEAAERSRAPNGVQEFTSEVGIVDRARELVHDGPLVDVEARGQGEPVLRLVDFTDHGHFVTLPFGKVLRVGAVLDQGCFLLSKRVELTGLPVQIRSAAVHQSLELVDDPAKRDSDCHVNLSTVATGAPNQDSPVRVTR